VVKIIHYLFYQHRNSYCAVSKEDEEPLYKMSAKMSGLASQTNPKYGSLSSESINWVRGREIREPRSAEIQITAKGGCTRLTRKEMLRAIK
jgi:hypothetical protein